MAAGDLFQRSAQNPILTADLWPYPINSVFNAGAVRLADGRTLLLVRVEDRRGISHLTAAWSDDGIRDWRIDPQPTFAPDPKGRPEEMWGIEDPRIVWMPDLDCYAVTYTSYSRGGPGVSLALTRDFKTFERKGVVMPPDDKDAALLPVRYGGRYVMIHRPACADAGGAHIWVSFSPDLKHWGDHAILLFAREGAWWDAGKIGLSPPPIETPDGWLLLYHGVRHTAGGCLYRLGAALLDRQDPLKVVLRGDEWLFAPKEPYELVGDVSQVVFPCGYTIGDDGDAINLYYGAADTSVALATGRVSEIMDWLKRTGRPDDAALKD